MNGFSDTRISEKELMDFKVELNWRRTHSRFYIEKRRMKDV